MRLLRAGFAISGGSLPLVEHPPYRLGDLLLLEGLQKELPKAGGGGKLLRHRLAETRAKYHRNIFLIDNILRASSIPVICGMVWSVITTSKRSGWSLNRSSASALLVVAVTA